MAHQVLKDSNGYPKNIGLGPVFEEGSKRQGFHLDLTGSADESLAMPTTETLLMTLKKNKTKEDPAAALDTLIPRLHAEAGCSRSIAWGQTQEDLRTVHLFLGWTSREVRAVSSLRILNKSSTEASRRRGTRFLRRSYYQPI